MRYVKGFFEYGHMLRSVSRNDWNANLVDKLTCRPSRCKQIDLPCTTSIDFNEK